MATTTPGFKPGHEEAIHGPRDGLDPLREAELVVDDGAAHLGLGAVLQQKTQQPKESGSVPDEDGGGRILDAG